MINVWHCSLDGAGEKQKLTYLHWNIHAACVVMNVAKQQSSATHLLCLSACGRHSLWVVCGNPGWLGCFRLLWTENDKRLHWDAVYEQAMFLLPSPWTVRPTPNALTSECSRQVNLTTSTLGSIELNDSMTKAYHTHSSLLLPSNLIKWSFCNAVCTAFHMAVKAAHDTCVEGLMWVM